MIKTFVKILFCVCLNTLICVEGGKTIPSEMQIPISVYGQDIDNNVDVEKSVNNINSDYQYNFQNKLFHDVQPQTNQQQINLAYKNFDYYQQLPPQLMDKNEQASFFPIRSETLPYGQEYTQIPINVVSDFKNSIESLKNNLGFLADSQRFLLDIFEKQKHYNFMNPVRNYESNEYPRFNFEAPQLRSENYLPPLDAQPTPQLPQNQQYPSTQIQSLPPLPPLPYGMTDENQQNYYKEHSEKTGPSHQHHNHHSNHHQQPHHTSHHQPHQHHLNHHHQKTRTNTAAQIRETRLQLQSQRRLEFLRNNLSQALWSTLVVGIVKIAPLLLFGLKMLFQSFFTTTGTATSGHSVNLYSDDDRADEDFKKIEKAIKFHHKLGPNMDEKIQEKKLKIDKLGKSDKKETSTAINYVLSTDNNDNNDSSSIIDYDYDVSDNTKIS